MGDYESRIMQEVKSTYLTSIGNTVEAFLQSVREDLDPVHCSAAVVFVC